MKKANILVIAVICILFFVFVNSIKAVQTQRKTMPKQSTYTQEESAFYVEGEVIVKFKKSKLDLRNQMGRNILNTFLRNNKIDKTKTLEKNNISLLKSNTKTTNQLVVELEKDPSVELVQPNYRYQPLTIPNDNDFPIMWGLNNTGQEVAGTIGNVDADIDWLESYEFLSDKSLNEVIVAVIDSGVAYNHPDLSSNMWDGNTCLDYDGTVLSGCNYGYDFEDNDKSPLPTTSSHGTHIAGTIAAVINNNLGVTGISYNTKIMALKTGLTTFEIIQAIPFAQYNGAKIINASWGGPNYDSLIKDAIESFDGLFITAAGNAGLNHEVIDDYPCDYNSDNIICVSATDQNDNLAYFSDYGAIDVDVGAPGENIISTYAETSMLYQTFEDLTPPNIPTGYTKTGDWGTYNLHGAWGNVMYGDLNYPYLQTADSTLTSRTVNLSNFTSATMSFWTACDTEYNTSQWTDYMSLETKSIIFTEDPPILDISWGEQGSGEGQFYLPQGVATDSQRNVYVADNLNYRIQKFDSAGNFIMQWHSGDVTPIKASKIIVDNNDNIYVLDTANYRIQKFTSVGGFITQWGSYGTGDGQFAAPSDFAVDNDNNIYVIEQGLGARIQKFSSIGSFIMEWGSHGSGDNQFGAANGIEVDNNNYVYVADTANHRIVKFSNDGTFITKWGEYGTENGQFISPYDIASDLNNDIYVLEGIGSRFQKFSSDGMFISKWTTLPYSQDITIDSIGNIYEVRTNINQIQKYIYPEIPPVFDFSFGNLGSAEGEFNNPMEMDFDSSGNIFVVDSDNNRIQKLSNNGIFVTQWGSFGTGDGQFKYPWGIAVDSYNNIYVSDTSNHRIQKFDNNGNFIKKWGSFGTGDGQFMAPRGIAVDSQNNVYVSEAYHDPDHNRIQKFNSDGTFITKWGEWGPNIGQFTTNYGIAIDSSNNIYVLDNSTPFRGSIQKFNSDGLFIESWGEKWGYGVEVDSLNNIYITSQNFGEHKIYKFSSTGNLITSWNNSAPRGVSIGHNNKVYVANGHDRIDVYNQSFNHPGPVPTEGFNELLRWDEVSIDYELDPYGSAIYYFQDIPLPQTALVNNYQFQLRWYANGNSDVGGGDGCLVDDIQILGFDDGWKNVYSFSDGTSMATPHVVGEAAVIWGYKSDLSLSQVKDIILESGDNLSSLYGNTVTGKRINLNNALKSFSKAAINNLPGNPTNSTNININVSGIDVVAYKYKLDNEAYGSEFPVATNINLSGLSEGNHTITVIGKDSKNNWQLESEATSYTWKIDTISPTATISYSTTKPTNNNVIATLKPIESVTVTNNDGSTKYTFTKNGSFTFTFKDLAGNTGSATAKVTNIDKTSPTATISYSTTKITNNNVVATLKPSESVTVTNNGGSTKYTFTKNGSFTFKFKDAAGNTATKKATVNNIDKTAPTAKINYSTTDITDQNVIVKLVPSETITVTNNNGKDTYTFTENGSFTFKFTDRVGNKGSATAKVNNIYTPEPEPKPEGKVKGVEIRIENIVVGTNEGYAPHVRIMDGEGNLQSQFYAYDASWRTGVNIAVGDVDGDGLNEIVTSPKGTSEPLIRIFNKAGELQSEFYSFPAEWHIGSKIAVGDVDGDGTEEIIVIPAIKASAHIRIFDYQGNLKYQFFMFPQEWKLNLNIAAGDVNGDGMAEIVASTQAGYTPHVRIFNYQGELVGQFFAYAMEYRGGVNLAVGDTDGDGIDEVITGAGQGYDPHVRIIDYQNNVKGQFYAYSLLYRGGVNLAAVDLNADGKDEIITGTNPGYAPHVRCLDSQGNLISQFYAYKPEWGIGVVLAGGAVD